MFSLLKAMIQALRLQRYRIGISVLPRTRIIHMCLRARVDGKLYLLLRRLIYRVRQTVLRHGDKWTDRELATQLYGNVLSLRFLRDNSVKGVIMRHSILAVTFLGILAGCASIPNGPSVAVMPTPGKSFDQFAAEDNMCRQFAQQSVGTSASQAATDSEVKSIAVGTAIGAVAGVLGNGNSSGAGSGAAVGMLGGAAMGSGEARYSERETQRRYDIAYEQCMYAKGNQLPQAAHYQPRVIYAQPPAPAPSYYPPPPPGQ